MTQRDEETVMTLFFKKTEATKPISNAIRELSELEMQTIGGGFNPQPDPPGRAMVRDLVLPQIAAIAASASQ